MRVLSPRGIALGYPEWKIQFHEPCKPLSHAAHYLYGMHAIVSAIKTKIMMGYKHTQHRF